MMPRAFHRSRRFRWGACWLLVAAAGCTEGLDERVGTWRAALDAPLAEAYCDAVVTGVGTVNTETEYLPNVINCENGGAELEALKVQAIAARSVLYHAMGTNGSICDGSSCQVYSCGKTPLAIHHQAVNETSGVYLTYNGNVTYAAYRAGDPDTSPPSCVGGPSETSAITYNEGKSGTDVEQTGTLFVHDPGDPGYGTNRGCMSQNGSSCLEESLGYDYVEILQFYYGEDIEMLQAPGPCVLPLPNDGGYGGAGGVGGEAAGGTDVAGAAPGGFGAGGAAVAAGGAVPRGVPGDDGDGGCSCRAAGARATGLPLGALLLGLVGLGLARRGRRDERLASAS